MSLQGDIGLGTFPFSNVFGKVTAGEADAITHAFLDAGGTYIQTAPYYEGVDPLVGGILKGVSRDRFRIGTLCVKDRDSRIAGSRSAVLSQCEDSLAKLGLDHIDIYLTSMPEGSDVPFGETIEAMEELRARGKIAEIGVCNVTLEQLQEYNASGSVRYVQNRFSILDQEQDRSVREYCAENGIGLIPYNVIEWGLLTSKIRGPLNLRDGDLRTRVLPVFEEEKVSVIRSWVESRLVPLASEFSTSIEAIAIGWVISQSAVAVSPVGATSRSQIRSSLEARALRGNEHLLSAVDLAYQSLAESIRSEFDLSLNEFLRNSFGLW